MKVVHLGAAVLLAVSFSSTNSCMQRREVFLTENSELAILEIVEAFHWRHGYFPRSRKEISSEVLRSPYLTDFPESDDIQITATPFHDESYPNLRYSVEIKLRTADGLYDAFKSAIYGPVRGVDREVMLQPLDSRIIEDPLNFACAAAFTANNPDARKRYGMPVAPNQIARPVPRVLACIDEPGAPVTEVETNRSYSIDATYRRDLSGGKSWIIISLPAVGHEYWYDMTNVKAPVVVKPRET